MATEAADLNVLKDVWVPLGAAAMGVVGALFAAYYTVIRPQRQSDDATADFETSTFIEAAQRAGGEMLTAKTPDALLSVEMEAVLRSRIGRFIDAIPKLAVRLQQALRDGPGANKQFHLMIIELDVQRRRPILDRHAILFAYGAAATARLLLRGPEREDSIQLLALLSTNQTDHELRDFFRGVVESVFPSQIRDDIDAVSRRS